MKIICHVALCVFGCLLSTIVAIDHGFIIGFVANAAALAVACLTFEWATRK